MRFLLYNVRYCAGHGPSFHFPFPFRGYLRKSSDNLQRISYFIEACKPDIVGLVEIDSGSFRTRKQNQAEIIGRMLGHYHVYQSKYGGTWIGRLPVVSKQGNAFLTNSTVRNEKFHYFERGIKRLVIELELEHVVVFLVHLSIRYRHRHQQLRDLYTLVRSVKKPCIVAGDFNALRGRKELDVFLKNTGLFNANKRNLPSHPSHAPHRHLDFVLHSRDIKVTGFEMPRVRFSDHLPLICDFEVAPDMAIV
jgi:endonuclease/exonuclease/phosphatase family metal-dependent hydrolase